MFFKREAVHSIGANRSWIPEVHLKRCVKRELHYPMIISKCEIMLDAPSKRAAKKWRRAIVRCCWYAHTEDQLHQHNAKLSWDKIMHYAHVFHLRIYLKLVNLDSLSLMKRLLAWEVFLKTLKKNVLYLSNIWGGLFVKPRCDISTREDKIESCLQDSMRSRLSLQEACLRSRPECAAVCLTDIRHKCVLERLWLHICMCVHTRTHTLRIRAKFVQESPYSQSY